MSDIFWIWIAVIVFSVFVEWATQLQLITVWAALGGIAALILELCGVDISIQIVVFFAVTIVMMLLTRPFAKKMTRFGVTPTNADMNIGKHGKVTKIIDEDMGIFRVRVDNCDWSAVTEEKKILPVGTSVSVLRIEGVKLIVEQQKQSSTISTN